MTVAESIHVNETVKPVISEEKPWRSLAKALSWRVVGTLDTFLLSFVLITVLGPFLNLGIHEDTAKTAEVAGYIAITEIITKIFIYWLHERAWAQTDWQVIFKDGMRQDSHLKSVVKTTTWRILAFIDTMALAWFFTGDIFIAFSIGGMEILTKMFLYFFHERLWSRLKIGLSTKI